MGLIEEANMSMAGWIDLKCHGCGGDLFTQAVKMVWKRGSGATPSPAGMRCIKCGLTVDVGKMTSRLELDEAKRLVASLEEAGH